MTTYPTQGCGCGHGRGRSSRFGVRGGYSKNPFHHLKWERNKNKFEKDKGDSNKNSVESSCYCCGMKGHRLLTCRTLNHFVELYQEPLKRNEKNVETNFVTEYVRSF